MCISDKNPHDLLSLVLRLIRDLDDRQSEDPSGILRSCAGWIPLCRSIGVQERPERYKRLVCASPAALCGGETSAKTCILDVAASSACGARYPQPRALRKSLRSHLY